MNKRFRVIDGDGHMAEPIDIWKNYVAAEYQDRVPKIPRAVGRQLHVFEPWEGHPNGSLSRPDSIFGDMEERYGDAYRSWWTMESRLAHMDAEGIDIMVGFPTNGGCATLITISDAGLSAEMCRAYNTWAAEFCAGGQGRVKFIAKVSMLDVGAAVREVQRVAPYDTVAGIVLPDPGEAKVWSDPSIDPLWAAICDAGLAACFHGGTSQNYMFRPWTDSGLTGVSHAIAFPVDAMLAMGSLVFGGVFDRFPALRAGFYEANAGWVPWWIARLDDHGRGRQARFTYGNELPRPASEYFRDHCWVACDADEGALAACVDALHGDNIVFNTDYPHCDAPFPGAVDHFVNVAPISDDDKRKILWDNSVALYGERIAPDSAVAV